MYYPNVSHAWKPQYIGAMRKAMLENELCSQTQEQSMPVGFMQIITVERVEQCTIQWSTVEPIRAQWPRAPLTLWRNHLDIQLWKYTIGITLAPVATELPELVITFNYRWTYVSVEVNYNDGTAREVYFVGFE